MQVVFPAPFGPSRTSTSPRAAVKSAPSSTSTDPYRIRRPRTPITATSPASSPRASFGYTLFTGGTDFGETQFTRRVSLEGAQVASAAEPGAVWPPGWTTRPAKPDGEDPDFLYLTEVEERHLPDA